MIAIVALLTIQDLERKKVPLMTTGMDLLHHPRPRKL